ncbi:hypothetical protein ACULL6_11070, partial [Xanthomonas arboricola pv. corylina]
SGRGDVASSDEKVKVRESSLGSRIGKTAAWNASTARRTYCSSNCTHSPNRFYGHGNPGAGSAIDSLHHSAMNACWQPRDTVSQ